MELQPERVRARLEKLGLVEKRPESHSAVTLKEWIDRYIETRSDVKPSTRLIYDDARQKLLAYFGDDRLLRDITAGDADEFRLHLVVGLGLTVTPEHYRKALGGAAKGDKKVVSL